MARMMQDVHAGQALRQGRGGRCMAAQGPGLTRAPRRDLGSSPATPITLLACSLQCCMLQLQARQLQTVRRLSDTDPAYTEN